MTSSRIRLIATRRRWRKKQGEEGREEEVSGEVFGSGQSPARLGHARPPGGAGRDAQVRRCAWCTCCLWRSADVV